MSTASKTTNPFESIKEIFSSGTNTIRKTTSSITSSIDPSYADYFNNNSLYIGLLIVIIICVIIAYYLYTLITTKLFLNVKDVANETNVPVICTEQRKINFTFEKTGNGERRSYTFWIYIHDMNKYNNNYKNVFSIRGNDKTQDLNAASPYIFLDSTQNRMYVRFGKTSININQQKLYGDISTGNLHEIMKQGIVIPYVPLQRWVHIAIVCNANSYKNYIYAYVDGDLVNTTSHGEYDRYITTCGSDNKCATKDLRDLDLNVNGLLTIGGIANDLAEGPGFSGLVSKITTFNYELNQKDIYDEYYNGPIGNLLAKVGLGMYGVRSPIYKL
jgi:hypothetical protein